MSAGAIGGLILLFNLRVQHSLLGRVGGYFTTEIATTNLKFYAVALLVLWPFMLLAPLLDRSKVRWLLLSIYGPTIGLYVFGGEGNPADPNGIFHEVEAYDPATDSWFELPPMQTGRHGIYAAVRGSVVYLPGGATVEGLGTTGIHDAYVIDAAGTAIRGPVVLTSPRIRPTPRSRPRD